jgi:hypothetical protein
VAEVALAFVLLAASGLLMRSFFKLLEVDPGFKATNVLTASLPIEQEQHPDPAELNTYLASIRAAVQTVPGVRDTALASALPLEGWGFGTRYSIAGRDSTDPANRPLAFFKIVSPSYVHALGIELRAGRVLGDNDTAGAPPVALINEALAKREFAGKNPIGQRIMVREIVAGRTELGREIGWENRWRDRQRTNHRARRRGERRNVRVERAKPDVRPQSHRANRRVSGITAERHSDGG